MPIDSILINASPGETRVALMDSGRLVELLIERAAEPSEAGRVFLGRVIKVVPQLQAAFVDVGLPRAGFLELGGTRLAEGDAVVVQVVRDGRDEKGPKLTRRLAVPKGAERAIQRERERQKAPARLWSDVDLILRTLRDRPETGTQEIVIDDGDVFAFAKAFAETHRPDLVPRLQKHRGPSELFATHDVEAQIEAALDPRVDLPSGGRLVIEETTALVAVDVDTGGAEAGGRGRSAKDAGARTVNREAAVELARQIRLRNLSGLIAVDFVPMHGKPARAEVLEILRRAAKADPIGFDVGGFTRFGLVEITRRMVGETLSRRLTVPEAGTGRIKSPLTLAYETLRKAVSLARARPGARLSIRAPAHVIQALTEAAGEARAEAEARLGFRLGLEADAGLAPDRIQLRTLNERARA